MRIRITRQIKNRICGYTKFRDKFEAMYGPLPTHRAKKKLKSVRHSLVNDNEKDARHFYKQSTKDFKIPELVGNYKNSTEKIFSLKSCKLLFSS